MNAFDNRCVHWKGEHYTDTQGVSYSRRVSSVAADAFEQFDADMVSGMCAGKGKYAGMTQAEVLEAWNANGELARTLGTDLHARIENHVIKTPGPPPAPVAGEPLSKEWGQFLAFADDYCDELRTMRAEWSVGDPLSGVAGTIDYVSAPSGTGDFDDDNNEVVLYDWKRCKEITNKKGGRCLVQGGLFADNDPLRKKCLRGSKLVIYSLQLCLYAEILEREYDIKVAGMRLVQFHETLDDYQLHEALPLRNAARTLLDNRSEISSSMLQRGGYTVSM